MGYKKRAEDTIFRFYRWIRKKSGVKKRRKEFERKNIPYSLSKKQAEEVYSFFAPYKKPNLIFHNYFTAASGVFYPNYIPQDLYVGYIDPYFNDILAAKYYENKCNYGNLFAGILQPRTIIKRVNGLWMDCDCRPLTREEIEAALQESPTGVFVKEAQTTAGGHGVTYIEKEKLTLEAITAITDKIPTDVIVQEEIRQHKDMARLNPSSVNSLRIYSVLHKNGDVTVYSSVVRMGVGDHKIDNFSAGGMTCGITPEGRLRKHGYNKQMEKSEVHPSSQIRFENYQIPNYDDAIALVKKAHPMVAHFRSVDWDIAIGEDGQPILIEANLCRGGIDSLQVNNGPLYGDDTNKILDEVFGIIG